MIALFFRLQGSFGNFTRFITGDDCDDDDAEDDDDDDDEDDDDATDDENVDDDTGDSADDHYAAAFAKAQASPPLFPLHHRMHSARQRLQVHTRILCRT